MYIYVCISILLRAHDLQVENAIPGVSPRGPRPLARALLARARLVRPYAPGPKFPKPKLSLTLTLRLLSAGEGLALRATPRP